MNQEKKKVGAKKKYKVQPRQMNVRFVKDTDHKKIKTLEKKLLKLNEIK